MQLVTTFSLLFIISYAQSEIIYTKKGVKLYYNSCFCGITGDILANSRRRSLSNQRKKKKNSSRHLINKREALKVGDVEIEDFDEDNIKLKFNIAVNLSQILKQGGQITNDNHNIASLPDPDEFLGDEEDLDNQHILPEYGEYDNEYYTELSPEPGNHGPDYSPGQPIHQPMGPSNPPMGQPMGQPVNPSMGGDDFYNNNQFSEYFPGPLPPPPPPPPTPAPTPAPTPWNPYRYPWGRKKRSFDPIFLDPIAEEVKLKRISLKKTVTDLPLEEQLDLFSESKVSLKDSPLNNLPGSTRIDGVKFRSSIKYVKASQLPSEYV